MKILNTGEYYSKTTSAFFWVEDNQTMKYVEEMASATIEYGYVIDGNKLIAVGRVKRKNLKFLMKAV